MLKFARAALTTAFLGLVVFAVACDDGVDTGARAEATPSPTESPAGEPTNTPAAAETPTNTPTPTPAPDRFVVGDTLETALGNQLTVIELEADVESEFWEPDPGMRFIAVLVEGCTGGEPASLNPFDFRVEMPDNTRLSAAVPLREPALSHTDLAGGGDCVRGWITFQVPTDTEPRSVNFETRDADFRPVVIKWFLEG